MTNHTEQQAHLLDTRALAKAVCPGGLFGVAHSDISLWLLVCSHVQPCSLERQRILYSFGLESCTLTLPIGYWQQWKLPISVQMLSFIDALSLSVLFPPPRAVNLINYQELLFSYKVNKDHSVLICIQQT